MDTHRYIARFLLEADTPLFVGSGSASLLKDALVQKDVNGFPMIQGTSLAGVLRHAFAKQNGDFEDAIFGSSNADIGKGSALKVSSAFMLLENNQVSEGIIATPNMELVNRFYALPSRQHVRINEKGAAEKHGLFDNEVVYKGTRFIFELELRGVESDNSNWNILLQLVQSPTFRIGSGTRNGYGSLKVIGLSNKVYDLTNETDFNSYLAFDPSFNSNLPPEEIKESAEAKVNGYSKYFLNLKPDSFFVFSEGFGDDEADNRPLEEEVVIYDNGKLKFIKQTVIPATSIKGALSHRVAFHYNKLKKQFADENKGKTGIDNDAVVALFGKAGKDVANPNAGNVFINDFYFKNTEIANNKIFNHVAIDRFTGGAMDGALFSEKVSNLLGGDFSVAVFVRNEALTDPNIKAAFENTLLDICNGLLPLGGMTTKGNGMFTRTVKANETPIANYINS